VSEQNTRVTIGFDSRSIDEVMKGGGPDRARHWAADAALPVDRLFLSFDPETWPRIEIEQLSSVKHLQICHRNGLGLFVEPLPKIFRELDFRRTLGVQFLQIAVDISENAISYLGNMFGQLGSKCVPTVKQLREQDWHFAGFDVVDIRTLVSSLSGFELSTQERARLASKFGDQLNSVGMFSDYGSAASYSTTSDEMFPEHAPFNPVGIWLEQDYAKISPELAAIRARG